MGLLDNNNYWKLKKLHDNQNNHKNTQNTKKR